MNPNDVLVLIEEIAALLEPGAQEVWRIVMKQAVLEGVFSVIWGLLLIGVGVGLFWSMDRRYRAALKARDDCYDRETRGKKEAWWDYDQEVEEVYPWWKSSLVALACLAPVGMILLLGGLRWLLNPQFQAIRYLLP